jgi:hypothetical protein
MDIPHLKSSIQHIGHRDHHRLSIFLFIFLVTVLIIPIVILGRLIVELWIRTTTWDSE